MHSLMIDPRVQESQTFPMLIHLQGETQTFNGHSQPLPTSTKALSVSQVKQADRHEVEKADRDVLPVSTFQSLF